MRKPRQYLVDCEVLSAMRNPLSGRSTASVEKLALRVRPWGDATVIKLQARGGSAQPLEGYEIFSKKPLPRGSEEKNTAQRLGLTDWRGSIHVPQSGEPMQLIYVKNGTHLIARLPLVPGYLPQVTLEIPSDDKRLEAEAFVQGMESTVMDLVARREVLAARIKRRIDQRNLAGARELLEEVKSFQTKDEMEAMLTARQQAGLASSDEREQRRIDQLLAGTRILLSKYLGPDRLVALERMVDEAESGGAVVPKKLPSAEAEP